MYLAQITKNRIKTLCKIKNINMENMLTECSLGVNAIRQINDTKGMASFSLAKIADYLDVSVDYLLGRTDTPNLLGNSDSNSGIINHNSLVNNSSQTISSNKMTTDETAIKLLEAFQKLDIFDKAEVMNLIVKLSEKKA